MLHGAHQKISNGLSTAVRNIRFLGLWPEDDGPEVAYNLLQCTIVRRKHDLLKCFGFGQPVKVNVTMLCGKRDNDRKSRAIVLFYSRLYRFESCECRCVEESVVFLALVDDSPHQVWAEQGRHSPSRYLHDHVAEELETP